MCLNDHQVKTWQNGPKWPAYHLEWPFWQFLVIFWVIKPSPFFQMGEISASVRQEARSDRGQKVPATKMAKKY